MIATPYSQRNRTIRFSPGWRDRHRSGFTLIELMVATAITAIVVAGTAITWVAATRNSREGGIDVQLDALIEDDISAIIDQSNRFTCCPGTCTSATSIIAAQPPPPPADCSTITPGLKPIIHRSKQTLPWIVSAMASFREQCRTPGALAEAYIEEINAIAVPPHSAPLSVVRIPRQ